MSPVLSVVVPVYNEEEVLPLLAERLRPVLDDTGASYEVVAVDDGSTDASAVVLQRMRRDWPQVRIVRLRANAGHQAAISAGLARSRGDYVVTIDADLQDPPETIAEMLTVAREEGVDVVYGVRGDRSTDTAFKRGTARAFYATMNRLHKSDAPADAGDFRLMSRATVDAVNSLPEHHRVLRLVVPALGFPSAQVTYRREERAAGVSKYPLSKMIALSLDSLTAHSMAPLRVATWCGLLGGLMSVLILIYALIARVSGHFVPGWTSNIVTVAAVGAIQLLCLGLLGEYVGRMYTMMQGLPTYFVAYDSAEVTHAPHTPTHPGRGASAAPAAEPTPESTVIRMPRAPEVILDATEADTPTAPTAETPLDPAPTQVMPAVPTARAWSSALADESGSHATSTPAATPSPMVEPSRRPGPGEVEDEDDAAGPTSDEDATAPSDSAAPTTAEERLIRRGR